MIQILQTGRGTKTPMADNSDPTKDPEFQKVIRHFVTTPHKPHEPLGGDKRKTTHRENGMSKTKAKPSNGAS
jgi:hypothetical protein